MQDRLEKQLEFILELDKMKQIVRQTYLADASRKENDAEHSWHMAVMCMLLSEYSNEDIDVLKTMSMLLVHDVVEIDAGDTYAYDNVSNSTKREREEKAANRLFGLLPEDQSKRMRELWDEFEEWNTPEAKFAHTLDNIQPLLLNDASGGRSWREHGIRGEQPLKRNKRTGEGSEVLYQKVREIIDKHIEIGNLKK
ncbi:MAG: HD domain-containing protein [Lachnospiraceae bacterium]|nr:HD domain-containing protein [Lachnospiraceae bacterium]